MGRKSLGERIDVRLDPATLDRIAALAPPQGRAQFIREAVQEKLDRRDAWADSASIIAALAARKASRTAS